MDMEEAVEVEVETSEATEQTEMADTESVKSENKNLPKTDADKDASKESEGASAASAASVKTEDKPKIGEKLKKGGSESVNEVSQIVTEVIEVVTNIRNQLGLNDNGAKGEDSNEDKKNVATKTEANSVDTANIDMEDASQPENEAEVQEKEKQKEKEEAKDKIKKMKAIQDSQVSKEGNDPGGRAVDLSKTEKSTVSKASAKSQNDPAQVEQECEREENNNNSTQILHHNLSGMAERTPEMPSRPPQNLPPKKLDSFKRIREAELQRSAEHQAAGSASTPGPAASGVRRRLFPDTTPPSLPTTTPPSLSTTTPPSLSTTAPPSLSATTPPSPSTGEELVLNLSSAPHCKVMHYVAKETKKPPKPKISKAKRSGIVFPVQRFINKMKHQRYADYVGVTAGVYTAAVIEYLVAEVLELAGAFTKDTNRVRITPRAINMTLRLDSELDQLCKDIIIPQGGVKYNIHPALLPPRRSNTSPRITPTWDNDMEF